MKSKGILGCLAAGAVLLHASLASAQTTKLNSYNDLVQKVSMAEEKAAPAAAPTVNCCPSDCCNNCCDKGHFYGMYENVLLTPHFSRNDAFGSFDVNGNFSLTELDWDLKYSPRFELGYLAPCDRLGFRLRYWHFDQDQSLAADVADGVINISDDPNIQDGFGGPINVSHALTLRVLDLEAMKRSGNLLFSGGLRYTRMDQDYVANFLGDDLIQVNSDHDFEGAGPTVAIEGRHRLGGSNLALFATARGSVLFGKSNWTASDSEGDTVSRQNDGDVLPIGEFQLGADWSRETRNGGLAFLRVALEGQYWIGAGSAMSTDLGGTSNDGGIADPQEPDMGLIGFTIGLGFAR